MSFSNKTTATIVTSVLAISAVLFLFCPALRVSALAPGHNDCTGAVVSLEGAGPGQSCLGAHTSALNTFTSAIPDSSLLFILVIVTTLGILLQKILRVRLRQLVAKSFVRWRQCVAFFKSIILAEFIYWLALKEKRDFALLA